MSTDTTTMVKPAAPLFDEARLAIAGFLHATPVPPGPATPPTCASTYLVRPARPRGLRRQARPHRAVRPDDGGARPGPIHHRPPSVYGGRLLPLRRDRRRHRRLAGIDGATDASPAEYVAGPKSTLSRPPWASTHGAGRLHRPGNGRHCGRPGPGLPARPTRAAHFRGPEHRHRAPGHRTGSPHRYRAGQGLQAGRHPVASEGGPCRRSGRR